MMKKIAIYGIVFILSICIASAACSVIFNKASYNKGETITATMNCSAVAEKNKAYTLVWYNQSLGEILETDSGTTPNAVDEFFTDTYDIASDFGGTGINATLTVDSVEKDTDNASVTDAGANDLLITSAAIYGKWLGLSSSVSATVTDENEKKISGGKCKFSVWSNDATQMLASDEDQIYDGELKFSWILDYESFNENVDYIGKLICFCGGNDTINECIDEDGVHVENSVGITNVPFTTNTWVTNIGNDFSPIVYENQTVRTDPILFSGFGEQVHWLVNYSNNRGEKLIARVRSFIINNETLEGHIESAATTEYSIETGNNTVLVPMVLSSDIKTGRYYVNRFIDIYYNNILVAEYIRRTENFNVTGTDDSFRVENIVTDKDNYYTGQEVHVCANISNNFDTRVEFEILYNFRCGSNNLDSDTDRTIIDEYSELRAVSGTTTQNQCAALHINFHDHLLYKKTQCYASVTVKSPYINTFDNKKSITSLNFNVTDYGYYPRYEINPTYPTINLFPDWRRFDDIIDNVNRSYYRTKINISDLTEEWLDPEDEIDNGTWDVYAICTGNMPISQEHYNYTVLNSSGDVIENTIEAKAIQWRDMENEEHSRCALGIENVNLSDPQDDYFEVRIWYEDFQERSTEALEGIENKTGTFHFDVECPTESDGWEITCVITGYIESGEQKKEVDFDCYLDNGMSAQNFNQMITKTPVSISRTFALEGLSETEHTVICKANYYNLGSRTDTFSDTFRVKSPQGSGISGGGAAKKGFKLESNVIFFLIGTAAFVIILAHEDEEKKKKRKDEKQ